MPSIDALMTVWDDPRNVETLTTMWADRKTASEIARVIGQGVTKNAVVGKATRLKLPPHGHAHRIGGAKAVAAAHAKRGGTGGPGQVKATTIRAARERAEDARQNGLLSHRNLREPFREGTLPPEDGVEVTRRIGLNDLSLPITECRWCDGDPLTAAHSFCGKPVKPGTSWCPEHHHRVFTKRT